MNLSEIAISFKGCTGETKISFKDHIKRNYFTPNQLEIGTTIFKANDYILRDIEILLDKAILNLSASDFLIRSGFFSWGFVTSYYSNFFSIQALNRLKLNFNTYADFGLECKVKNYLNQELEIKKVDISKGSHENQLNRFYENYSNFRNRKSIDRYWTLGINSFKLEKKEALLRNEINYSVDILYYYELNLNEDLFKKIILDNSTNPEKNQIQIKNPINYSIYNLELAISRIRVIIYILNYMANVNNEYTSYYSKRCNERLKNLKVKFPNLSPWILALLTEWLKFNIIETDDVLKK